MIRPLDPQSIVETVAIRHGLAPDDLTGKRQSADIVEARHEAMLALRELTSLSLPEIGRMFGGRDHTTVMSGIDRASERRDGRPVSESEFYKRCSNCRETKPRAAFALYRSKGDGRQAYCRECSSARKREQRRRAGGRTHRHGTKQVSINLTEELIPILKDTAAEHDLTVSQLVERAVEREVARLWLVCRQCGRRRRMADRAVCEQCFAGRVRGRDDAVA